MRLLTACVTPFLLDCSIDFLSLEQLLRFQNGIADGILLLGTTGEILSLTLEEKQEIVSFACNLQLDLPIFVGVPGILLNQALQWIDFCNHLPISGFLMTSPIYARPGIRGQTLWFQTLLNAAVHPVILYNIPLRAAAPLYVETVQALAHHPQFYAIKDSGDSIERFQHYRESASHIRLYCGNDQLWPKMAACGAYGMISATANIWPKQTRDYINHPSSVEYDTLWQEMYRWLYRTTNPIAVKVVLNYKKHIATSMLRLPLSVEDFDQAGSLPLMVDKMNNCWPQPYLSK
ncbi:4-hydroxy-tetrahydrodipicolinate synthase [Candidatus Chlamydia sanziniae]|uniref:4-hydroxy-tetrahydrodipicolinate synthase n=1 Tax=Candidatus Chlamydia sanziniae TaxID=1806891 RepID=A0A1A9HXM5_9CHLA|nr:4-hydroxy-tetrahydrodipicolinate synthase [Candidatus Chlamydia sanziniae]ANH78842.1 4-hydroxy-tetrahydrodipicolinate synthase [Candidatus Chlamydia sanziniae]